MASVRPPAVAGMFYPGTAAALNGTVRDLCARAPAHPGKQRPWAVIAPHAGYQYSGATAAEALSLLAPFAGDIRRVLLLGPTHRVPVSGMAVPTVDSFDLPSGRIALDKRALDQVLQHPGVMASDLAHAHEHSLEVHLPFLQHLIGDFDLIPVVVGDAEPAAVAGVIESFLDDDHTQVVVSSDLSHFHDYRTARSLDAGTSAAIEALSTNLTGEQACGCRAINGLLLAARRRRFAAHLISQCNSGDTAGDKSRVVGYGGYSVT